MKNNATLIAFGTFGSPNGFKQTTFLGNTKVQTESFDLEVTSIKLFPNNNLIAVRKERQGVSYVFYSYAREKGSSRGGTFIGSALYFEGQKASEDVAIKILSDFHQYLYSNNVQNSEIQVFHSNELEVIEPQDFENLKYNSHTLISLFPFTKKSLVVYDSKGNDKLQYYFKNAPYVFSKYDVVYFTSNREVAEYVQQRGLFDLIEGNFFEKEIEIAEAEKKEKINQAVQKVQQLINQKQLEGEEKLKKFQFVIDNNKKIHAENDRKIKESEQKNAKIQGLYRDFIGKLKNIQQESNINNISKIPDIVRNLENQLLNEVREIFSSAKINPISEERNPFPKPQSISQKRQAKFVVDEDEKYQEDVYRGGRVSQEFKKNKLIYILNGVAAFIAIVLGLLWFFSTKESAVDKIEDNSVQKITTFEEKIDIPTQNPLSNETKSYDTISFLNDNDTGLVNRKLHDKLGNIEIDDVVEVIIKLNPTDVGQYYNNSDQKDIYEDILLKYNQDCFDYRGDDWILVKALQKIPKGKND